MQHEGESMKKYVETNDLSLLEQAEHLKWCAETAMSELKQQDQKQYDLLLESLTKVPIFPVKERT
jgi:hypothetical protein